MPKLFETCVLSGIGFSATERARLIDFRLSMLGCHAYVSGTNGVGKTSNVIQPLFWLLKPREEAAGRSMRSIIEDGHIDAATPYVFYAIWGLDESPKGKLDYDRKFLCTGYVLNPQFTGVKKEMQVDFFYFHHSLLELQTDRDGLLRRHGIVAFERNGTKYRFRNFEDIHRQLLDAKAAGTVVFPIKDHSKFRRALEEDMSFFDIDRFAILQEVAVRQENAIGNLDSIYPKNKNFLDKLLLPIISSKSFDEKTRDSLIEQFARCGNSWNNERSLHRKLDYCREQVALLDRSIADSAGLEELAASLKEAVEVSKGFVDAKDPVLAKLEGERIGLAAARGDLQESLDRTRLEQDSWKLHKALKERDEAVEEAERAEAEAEKALEAFEKADEIIKRRDVFESRHRFEEAEGTVEGLKAKMAELEGGVDGKRRENLGANINRLLAAESSECERRAAEEASRCAEAQREAAAAESEANDLEKKINVLSKDFGAKEADWNNLHSAVMENVKRAGCDHLVKPRGTSPDIAGMEAARRVAGKQGEEVSSRIARCSDEQETAEDEKASLISTVEDAEKRSKEASERKVVLKSVHDSVSRAAKRVSDLNLEIPRDATESLDDDGKLEQAESSKDAEIEAVSEKLRAVRRERDGLDGGAAHVPAAITKILDEHGIAYQTGQSRLERAARNGMDVQEIVAYHPAFASSVIVSADKIEFVRGLMESEESSWCAGAVVILSDAEAEEIDIDADIESRILALPHKRFLAEGESYLAFLADSISDLDERMQVLREEKDKIRVKRAAIASLGNAYRDMEQTTGYSTLALLTEELARVEADIDAARTVSADGRARIGEIEKRIEELRARAFDLAKERDLVIEKSRILGDAIDKAHALETMFSKIRELEDKIGRAEREKRDARKLAMEKRELANACKGNASSHEAEASKLSASAKAYSTFDPGIHSLLDGDLNSLKAQYSILKDKLEGDQREIQKKLDKAASELKKSRDAFKMELDVYAAVASTSKWEDIAALGNPTETEYRTAYVQGSVLEKEKNTLANKADDANKRSTKAAQAAEEQASAFNCSHEGADLVPIDEIGGIDFDRREADIRRAMLKIDKEIGANSETIGKVVKASSSLAKALDECLQGYSLAFGLDAGLKAREVEVERAEDYIERAAALVQRIKDADGRYRNSNHAPLDRNLRAVRAKAVNHEGSSQASRISDAIDRAEKSFVGRIGLTECLRKFSGSWQREVIALSEELKRSKEDIAVLAAYVVNIVDGLVDSARSVEKRSGRVLRLSGMGKGHPSGDEVFRKSVEMWVEGAVEEISRKVDDVDKPVRARIRDAYAEAGVLLNLWAKHNNVPATEAQLRIFNGQTLVNTWESWTDFNIKHSGGETSTTLHQVGAALLSLCKPVDPTTGKICDYVTVPFIQDAPFKSVSNDILVERIFDIYERNGIQLVGVADDNAEIIRTKFPIRYRLVTKKHVGGWSVSVDGGPTSEIINGILIDEGVSGWQQSLNI